MRELGRLVLAELIPASGPILTTQHVARVAQTSSIVATRALRSLARNGLLVNLSRGIWADVRHPHFSPYAVVPFILARSSEADPSDHAELPWDTEIELDTPVAAGSDRGYVSFVSALSLHGMLSQIPREIHVAVLMQRPRVVTPVATYEFHRLTPDVFGGIESGDRWGRFALATPAKALVDTIYLSIHRGRQFAHLPELEVPDIRGTDSPSRALDGYDGDARLEQLAGEVEDHIQRIRNPRIRTGVRQRWAALHDHMRRYQYAMSA